MANELEQILSMLKRIEIQNEAQARDIQRLERDLSSHRTHISTELGELHAGLAVVVSRVADQGEVTKKK